jgi:hypothetical protein
LTLIVENLGAKPLNGLQRTLCRGPRVKSKTLKRFVVVALACIGLTCATSVTLAQHAILAPPNNSCGTWTNLRKLHAAAPYEWWVVGFLSGLSVGFLTGVNADDDVGFLSGQDADGIYAWIDNYCKANPLEKLPKIMDTLATELIKRADQKR